MKAQPTLTVTHDFTKTFNETIKKFRKDAVLIGIPSTEEPRKDDDEITNAAILAINHFGSDDGHIPPRPVLTIGLKNAKEPIAKQMALTAKEALEDGVYALDKGYERVGIIASNAVKKVINDQQDIQGPAESTLKARQYLTQSGFKGTKSLLVTGQLRNAITYVVNKWGK